MAEATKKKSRKQDAAVTANRVTSQDRQILEHRGHTIIAGLLGGKSVAQVYLGPRMATKERFQGDSLDDVLLQAQSWVEEKLSSSAAQRRAPSVATEQEYADVLATVPLNRFQKAMLLVHTQQGFLTAEELAKAAGYKTVKKALESYAKLGESLAQTLGLEIPAEVPAEAAEQAPPGILVLAAPEASPDGWRIHSELQAAAKAWSEALQSSNA